MRIKGLISNIFSHSLFKNSMIVLIGAMAANVLSYAYHLAMGRVLGPSGYGELSALLSLLYIFTVPLLVAQTVLVKFVSGFKAHGDVGQAKSLFYKTTKLFVMVSVIGLPIVFISGPLITSFLHLSSPTLVLLLYALLVFSLLTVATGGIISGYQKFIWVSVMGALAILMKLLVSIPLVGWGVEGMMLAAVIAGVIVYGLYFIPIRFLLSVRAKPTRLSARDAFGFAVPTLLVQLGITSLYSTDIILVRHFFNAHDAGLYAALAILGKIIFYASSAASMVLFPVLSERFAKGGSTKKLVWGSVGAVSAASLGLTLVYFLFPDLIVRLLFGNAYAGAGALLGMFGIFIALFSVGNIVSLACLAVGKTGVWVVPFFCAILQIVAIVLLHPSVSIVIALNIGISLVFVLGSGGYYLLKERTISNKQGTGSNKQKAGTVWMMRG